MLLTLPLKPPFFLNDGHLWFLNILYYGIIFVFSISLYSAVFKSCTVFICEIIVRDGDENPIPILQRKPQKTPSRFGLYMERLVTREKKRFIPF